MKHRKLIVSQRVEILSDRNERRDALDQRWSRFLNACGLLPIAVPNDIALIDAYLALEGLVGILLTGGNDLPELGEPVPERDAVEIKLIETAMTRQLPLLGVCRGMQMLQHAAGCRLEPVSAHLSPRQTINIEGQRCEVNSYHRFGTRQTCAELDVWAHADDGVIKAIRCRDLPLVGIMWHPERIVPFAARDLNLFRQHFGTS